MSYRLSRRADRDIQSICEHISDHDPAAADRLENRIHESLELLAKVPGMGHTRPDVKDNRYRFWAVGEYIIAYRFEKELVVVRVLHGACDFRNLFKDKS